MFKPVSPKVEFPLQEKELLKKWYESGIVEKYLHRNDKSSKRFSFFDGPITANNPMGVHHAWGRTYKDLWQKFHNMQGFKQRFQNGFDCQGLWVEVEVEKELGIRNKKEIENLVEGDRKKSIAKFIELCKERVLKYSQIQTEQTKRLGNFMDWDNSYYTMSDENNYMIWHFLKTVHEKGWMYKGRDSVPWCPRCETAISQHEISTEEYKELTHETVFAKLQITTKGWENISLLIWTTTPWTVPANVAVGVNIKFTYGVWEDELGEKYIFLYSGEEGEIAKRSYKKEGELSLERWIMKDSGRILTHSGKNIKGKELLGITYEGPFDNLPIVKKAKEENPETFHKVVDASNIVTSEEGTGLLHLAPGAGKEDFDLGKKEHMSVIVPIDEAAGYVEGMDEFSGKNAKKHPEVILDYLKNLDHGKYFFKTMRYTHRYPACWRCKTELVWRVTDEWYIAMDIKENGNGKTLREQMVDTAKMIDWHPKFGLDRELDWLKNMHDWLISKKNRYWGLALPVYECLECGNFEVIGSKDELKEKAVDGWSKFENHSPHKPYIDEVKIKCSKCDKIVSRTDDVGNVWLDAGIVPFSTLIDPATKQLSYTTDKTYWREWFPADFITEQFAGQFRNWFYALIAMSTVLEKRNSFNTLLGYGTVVGEDGKPMHKSWGNSIEFNEGADKIGVDVMRWMYATADPEQNLSFGYKKADETRRRFHLMLWNIYNFFITYANIDKWKSNSLQTGNSQESILDRWIISRLNETIRIATESLKKYDPQKAALNIEYFVSDLSLWYVRRSRERVGPSVDNEEDKKVTYETLYYVLITLSKLLAPFTPFLADEIYVNLTSDESVHLANWPEVNTKLIDENLHQQMKHVRKIVELGLAARKEAQIKVKQPLSEILISPGKKAIKFGQELDYLILDELNIKKITYKDGNEDNETIIELNTILTDDLIAEKEAREIVRMIQEERKKIETALDEKVDINLEKWPENFEEYIKKNALVRMISKGNFEIKRL